MASFVENINKLADKLDIIIESNGIFDESVIPVLQEIADLDLQNAVWDLKKGNHLGNRKIDINLALNMQGITEDLIKNYPDQAEDIWTDIAKTVYYDKAIVTFVDGEVITMDFTFDGNPINISTHGDLLIQFNNNQAFLNKLETTAIVGFSADVVGEIVRIYDIIGSNSNVESIKLHATEGAFKEEYPIYFWAKTTSSFQTLAMRAGDIIKLGNEIDNIITLANDIEKVLEIQERIPEFIDTYDVNGDPNYDLTIYNKLQELDEIYSHLVELLVIYEDLRVNGTNYIQSVATDLQTDNNIKTVADDLNLGASSKTNVVASNILDVTTVSDNISDVVTTAVNIADINTVVANITDIQNAEANANTATLKAQEATDQASIATNQAVIATNAADDALAKANEIKNVSVGSTSTGNPGTSASVNYNSSTGQFSFVIPEGIKGDKGDAFTVDAVGLEANRSNYDAEVAGFSYLSTDTSLLYFKLSATAGDWSVGTSFGKGDKGDTGDTGNGILSIVPTSTTNPGGTYAVGGYTDTYTINYTDGSTTTFDVYNGKGISSIGFTSTTDPGGLQSQPGETDTYTINYTDGTTSTFTVVNGSLNAVTSVAGREGDVVLTEADISDLQAYALIGHTHSLSDVTDVYNSSPADKHVLVYNPTNTRYENRLLVESDISNLANYSLSGHNHVEADITDLDKYSKAQVDNALDGKSNTTHNHDLTYLGIDAKAKNSALLDGYDYSYFSPTTHHHDADYSAINHNHDLDYSTLGHSHDSANITDVGAETISTAAPSGGSNGDKWFQV